MRPDICLLRQPLRQTLAVRAGSIYASINSRQPYLPIAGFQVRRQATKEFPTMKKGRSSEEQIIGMRKQHEAGRKVADLAREQGISEATIYTWKSKYGGLEVSEAQRLRSLEDENRRLKHLVADLSLDKEVLKAIVRKNGWSLPAGEPMWRLPFSSSG